MSPSPLVFSDRLTSKIQNLTQSKIILFDPWKITNPRCYAIATEYKRWWIYVTRLACARTRIFFFAGVRCCGYAPLLMGRPYKRWKRSLIIWSLYICYHLNSFSYTFSAIYDGPTDVGFVSDYWELLKCSIEFPAGDQVNPKLMKTAVYTWAEGEPSEPLVSNSCIKMR